MKVFSLILYFFALHFIALYEPNAHAFEWMYPNMKGWENDIVTLHINPDQCTGSLPQFVNNAIAVWNAVPGSRIKMRLGTPTSQRGLANEPIIECTELFGQGDTVGTTSVATDREGHIVSVNVKLNARRGSRGDISIKSASVMELAVIHELGHVLGLGHSRIEAAMMFFSITNKSEPQLHADDVDGLLSIYGGKKKKGPLGCGQILNVNKNNSEEPSENSLWSFLPLLAVMMVSLLLGQIQKKKRTI